MLSGAKNEKHVKRRRKVLQTDWYLVSELRARKPIAGIKSLFLRSADVSLKAYC